ncbi:bifunctional indole-3-glycerol-phosphate synthase TrpC/phosphoribosylanthranilate isomerase TrpF [Candidatus Peregrinibacteria bacterium]|jgi:indole-3-glycerol phosphate synthase / phosphoribosylanthranilate isomerase|nr:bifunctional indole-3-glycerol-phosphate synthase TrpC/phosphoribosylanthranilate isomerase TrpF [Candidatus Peregrinibacteria bacterium]
MNDILSKIIEYKKKELIKRKTEKPLLEIKKNIKNSDISFLDSIKGKNRVHLIAEIKRASPSKGIIVKNFQLEETISLYNKYASAISVLTDEHFFGGSFYNLKRTSELSYLPLICKDFIIDEYQIHEARYHGANAILLIAAVLDTNELKHLYKIAESLAMDVLFEVHNEEELEKVLNVKPKIIGVNNRNLKDFSIDLNLTKKLSKKIPDDIVIVAESGISCKSDVVNVLGVADAMLVGTSIMGSKNPNEKIQELTMLPKIKICGIINAEDAIEAIKCGASYIGLIFANESPRKIDIKKAKEIITHIKKACHTEPVEVYSETRQKAPPQFIGVFVNQTECFQTAKDLELDGVQLHGEEGEEFIKGGKKIFKGEIWKAVNNEQWAMNNEQWEDIDVLLIDNATKEKRGGTGEAFNWELLSFPRKAKNGGYHLALAGGINPQNIQKARKYSDILDIGSGVEEKPGEKNFKKIRELFWNLKD